eukprot:jgi/Tetstr1/450020/TSEL_037067.t1
MLITIPYVVIADASHIGAAALVVGQAVTFLRAQHATLSDAGAFFSDPSGVSSPHSLYLVGASSIHQALATPTLELDAGANASAPMWAIELRAAHTRVVDECGDAPAASEFCRKCGKSTTVDGLPVVPEEALVSAVTEAMYDRMNGHGHHMELPTGYSVGPSDPKAWPFLTAFDDPKVYAMRELHALCEAHFMDPMDDSDALRDVMG